MSTVEKVIGILFTLTVLVVILKNASSFNSVVNGLAGGVKTVSGTFINA